MTTSDAPAQGEVVCHLGDLLDARAMSLVELSSRIDITVANLSVLKNDRARAIRFSTLIAICGALDCQPGELLSVVGAPTDDAHDPAPRAD